MTQVDTVSSLAFSQCVASETGDCVDNGRNLAGTVVWSHYFLPVR